MLYGDALGVQRWGFPRYFTSKVLFGLHKTDPPEPFILCEGELDVVALSQKGFHNGVAVNGSHFSQVHQRLLIEHTDDVIIFFDGDNAGRDAVEGRVLPDGSKEPGIIDRLKNHVRVRIVGDHDGDPASMSADDIGWCLDKAKSYLAYRLSRR
jgi:hypothetical protein